MSGIPGWRYPHWPDDYGLLVASFPKTHYMLAKMAVGLRHALTALDMLYDYGGVVASADVLRNSERIEHTYTRLHEQCYRSCLVEVSGNDYIIACRPLSPRVLYWLQLVHRTDLLKATTIDVVMLLRDVNN
jgi:hypothetical protein